MSQDTDPEPKLRLPPCKQLYRNRPLFGRTGRLFFIKRQVEGGFEYSPQFAPLWQLKVVLSMPRNSLKQEIGMRRQRNREGVKE